MTLLASGRAERLPAEESRHRCRRVPRRRWTRESWRVGHRPRCWFRSSWRRGKSGDPLEELTRREREVLALMAEGRSNAGIGRRLWITEGTVEKHVHSILTKLRLPETDDDHRRVLAVVSVPGHSSDQLGLVGLIAVDGGEHLSDRCRRQVDLRQEIQWPNSPGSGRRTRLHREWRSGSGGGPRPDPAARAAGVASSSPLSPPRSMSISATSGRSSAICRCASAADPAPPTTSRPCSASRPRISSRKLALSSTIRQRKRIRRPRFQERPRSTIGASPQNDLQGSLPPASVKTNLGGWPQPQIGRWPCRQGESSRRCCTGNEHRTADHGTSPPQILRRSRRRATSPPDRRANACRSPRSL